jgi:glycosyltransferase involved in cell wall biosynthesis
MGICSVDANAGQQKLFFLAKELERMGVHVDVAVTNDPDNAELLETLKFNGRRFTLDGSSAWKLRASKGAILGRESWDVVHSIGIGVRSLVPRRIAKVVLHDFDEWMPTIRSYSIPRRLYWKWITRRMCRESDGVSCASDFIVREVRQIRPDLGSKALYMPVGVDPAECKPDPGTVAGWTARFGQRPVLSYVGGISPMYREQVAELVSLAAELARRPAGPKIFVAGGGPDLEYWKAEIKSQKLGDSIEFVGPIPRQSVASYLEASTCLIFPIPPTDQNIARCPTKGFHYAIANKPVVTNPTGEVHRLFGDQAFYYRSGDVADLTKACQAALAAASGYDNTIPMERLTWRSRAQSLHQWIQDSFLTTDNTRH